MKVCDAPASIIARTHGGWRIHAERNRPDVRLIAGCRAVLGWFDVGKKGAVRIDR
jgi:hypothetical protein